MQTLKYVIGKDYRPLTTLEAKSSNVSNIDYGNNPNWVQARQYEDGLRQVFVEITNEDGSPYDLTGSNVLFEGILPDNEHKILDNSHAVFYEDPTSGKFRFDLPAAAFAVAGQYKQAFFRITKGYQNVATLEFKLEVLADMVISGLVPSDYISPLEDFLTEVKAAESKTLAELKDTQNKTLDDIKANGDKALATLQDLEIQNVATLKKIVDDKVNEINNLMAITNSSNQSVLSELTNAKNLLVDLQTKIKEDGLFTKYEADNLFEEFKDKTQQLSQKVDTSMSEAKTLVENKIAQMDNGVHGYPNANTIKQAYPNGAQGIFVAVDTGHQWYYVNGQWVDGGVYQAAETGKVLTSDTILESSLDYSTFSSWNGGEFEVNDKGVIDFSDGNYSRGIIFRVEEPNKSFNFKVIENSLENGSHLDFWKYDPQANNHVGQALRWLSLEKDLLQKIPLDGIGQYMIAIHGQGTIKFKFAVSDFDVLDLHDLSDKTYKIDTTTLVDKNELGDELPLAKVGLFGPVTMDDLGDKLRANVTGNGGGFFTLPFSASSERVKVVLDGSYTQRGITIQIGYTSLSDNEQRYLRFGNFQGGTLPNFEFDASSLIIYQHADKDSFRILIHARTDSVDSGDNDLTGEIILKSIHIKEGGIKSNLYDYKLKTTLLNLVDKLATVEADVDAIKAVDNLAYVTMPDGSKGQIVYANGVLTVKNTVYKKILFIGNSLLLGLSTNGEHGAPFGMTASSPEKDWAYLLTKKLETKYNTSVSVSKLHGAAFEQSETDEASENYINNNFAQAEKNNDLVIVQIGDNANSDIRRTTFKANLEKLINAIKSANPTADILIAGVWFDSGDLQSWLRDFTIAHKCMFAPLRDLDTYDNIAIVGDMITFADGTQTPVYDAIKTHPGDKGHALITDRIYSTLYPK